MQQISRNANIALTGAQSDKISEAKVGTQRLVIVVTNLNAAGGASCWLSCGAEAANGFGIQLAAGQSMSFSKDAGYSPSNDTWNAFAAAGGTNLAVYEEVLA